VAKSSLEELALPVSSMAFLAVVKALVRMFIAHFAPGGIACCPRNRPSKCGFSAPCTGPANLPALRIRCFSARPTVPPTTIAPVATGIHVPKEYDFKEGKNFVSRVHFYGNM
jgi:hypothetical protein